MGNWLRSCRTPRYGEPHMRTAGFEEQEFTPGAVLRVATPNSVWLLTTHRYQRLPRREQPRGATVAIDGRLDDGRWHELRRCW